MDTFGTYTITSTAVSLTTNINSPFDPDLTIASATSRPFKVLPRHLAFVAQPVSIATGFPIPSFQVRVEDAQSDPITSLFRELDLGSRTAASVEVVGRRRSSATPRP